MKQLTIDSRFDVERAVVCQEKHEDGEPHLHALIEFKARVTTRDCHYFDVLAGKHGDVAPVRNFSRQVAYVLKGGDFLATPGFDPVALVEASKKHKAPDRISKLLLEKPSTSIKDLATVDPAYVMRHAKEIIFFKSLCERWALAESFSDWVEIPLEGLCGPSHRIAEWLNLNLGSPRKFKQPQLYIVGAVGCGKSHLLESLMTLVATYMIPKMENWDDNYRDGVYSLAIMDEFKRHKPRYWLLEWLQGGTMSLSRRGLSPYLKRQNIPTIICSNYTIDHLYSDPKYAGTTPALNARLTVVYVPEGYVLDIWQTLPAMAVRGKRARSRSPSPFTVGGFPLSTSSELRSALGGCSPPIVRARIRD